jgi:hypothetical protein
MSEAYDWKKALLSEAPMNLGPSQVLALQVHTSELLDEVEKLNMQINKLVYVVDELNSRAIEHDDNSLSSKWIQKITGEVLKEIGENK